MSDPALSARFSELTQAGCLAEANLLLARQVRPDLDSDTVLRRIDDLAARVEGKTHLSLRRVISIAEGIGGNVDDYYNPNNHYLDTVLASRRGVPITLSVLWMEVGRRVGIEMEGVGMPGHFLVYAGGQLVDPFHYGEAIGFDEAARLVAEALGGEPRADRSWFDPIDPVDIGRRMLRNLESLYQARGEVHQLAWVEAFTAALP